MKFTFSKFIAVCALLGAGVLLFFELRDGWPRGDQWLWLLVGALAISLALAELFLKKPKR